MSTLTNHFVQITAPKGVIPDLTKTGQTRETLDRYSEFFAACAGGMAPGQPGESRLQIHKGSTLAAAMPSWMTVAIASVLADTVIEINGVPFSAINGSGFVGNNEFNMSGSDPSNATSLCGSINASVSAGISGDVEACNLAGTITLVSVPVGAQLVIDGRPLTARAFATGRQGDFDVSGSDTADATALAAAINADRYFMRKVVATASSNVVTVRQRGMSGVPGLTMATTAASMTLGGLGAGKLAATSTLLVQGRGRGTMGNALRIVTKGVVAAGTVTYAASSGVQTVSINGVQVYNATGASDAANATAAAAAINASTNPLVQGFVRAVARVGVLKVFSLLPGLPGNTILLAATGTGATASGARLTGGTETSSGGAQASGTFTITAGAGTETATINGVAIPVTWAVSDNNTAGLLAAAINSSTNPLVQGQVFATAAANVVTVTSIRGGVGGNATTIAATGTGNVASGATLAGGAVPTTVVPSAERMSGGVGGDDTAPFVYQF